MMPLGLAWILLVVRSDQICVQGRACIVGARMTTRTLGVLLLLLGPLALAYGAGFTVAAHYGGLGVLLAVLLGVLARPVAGFSILLPMVYAAAAITGQASDGVVALVVAIAAAVGAASSQGLHRGLVALLAAALLGSFEPATHAEVLTRAGWMLAGSSYGFLLATVVLRRLRVEVPHLHPHSALGYAVLLSVVVLVAWFAARQGGLPHPWWLPLAVVALSDPAPEGALRRALGRGLLLFAAVAVFMLVVNPIAAPLARVTLLLAFVVTVLATSQRRPELSAVLLTPVLLLVSGPPAGPLAPVDHLHAMLPALVSVLAVTTLGHWVLWALRSNSGRVAA